jgi:dolichol-phosphate mannosyltransferase
MRERWAQLVPALADLCEQGMTSSREESSASGVVAHAKYMGTDDAEPTFRDALAYIRSRLGATVRQGAPNVAWRVTGIVADILVTLSVLASANLTVASLTGFIAGVVVWICVHAFAPKGTIARDAHGQGYAVVVRGFAVAALALGLRGGVIAAAIAVGFAVWLATLCGIAAGWLVLYVGDVFYVRRDDLAKGSDNLQWMLAAFGIVAYVVLLHGASMQPLPVMPQEAYYWNYSIHPDFSYHDHPPMVAWLIAAGELILGHGPAAVRLAALACGIVVIFFTYRLARRLVDREGAIVAAALAAVLPYFFFAGGGMMTPDTPLAAAWVAALYFFHRALVGGERPAWLGVGVAMGLGLLSKYTIALLAPAALVFCLLDKRARECLLRPEPYLAILVALAVFAPVVYWNSIHDWASFKFQTQDRFGTQLRFSLHRLLGNALVVVTPLPFIALPLLFANRWTEPAGLTADPAHSDLRNRRFVGCFVLAPLAVFAWDALRHLPRLNWTGPIWLAVLPLLGWAIVHASSLRARGIGRALRATAPPLLAGLLVLYAVLGYYVALGFPGVGYPKEAAPLLGWAAAARELSDVRMRVEKETGDTPTIVGMDAYQIASELSFYSMLQNVGEGARLATDGASPKSLNVTAIGKLFGGEGLMFAYWNPPSQLRGRTLIMVARNRDDLLKASLAKQFSRLETEVQPLPLIHSNYGGRQKPVAEFYYRVGYGYQPFDTVP